ncbi:MAG: ATP-dependent Clp protease ATP-binding subunit, partial [Oscillospiraceae bacterium]|nr:ATP-dependent Clp protease ATP-binding subunit [Oscillospiraceae bacterium]
MKYEANFTDSAKNALSSAHEKAAEMGHGYVGTEHILYGIVCEEKSIASDVLRRAGLDKQLVLTLIDKYVGRGESAETTIQGLTPMAKRIIHVASAHAARLRHDYVGTEHILMGILTEPGCVASRIISVTGAIPTKLFKETVDRFAMPELRRSSGSAQDKANRRQETKTLEQYSRDLTEAATSGQLDPVVGRESEIQRVIQILSRRTKNNPVLIGEPGVGKTAIAEGLAQKIASGDVPDCLHEKRIKTLDLTGMVAGTKYRGDFEERIKSIIDEVKKAGDIILFIDVMHTLIGAGAAEGAIDAANIIKP